jgi:hypothetical protein
VRVVGECSAEEPGKPGSAIADALDDPERRGRSAEQARQERGRYLVAEIGQEAGRPDAGHTRGHPTLFVDDLVARHDATVVRD